MPEVNLELPWGPSVNTYWRRNGGRYFISKKGVEYRQHVLIACRPYSGLFNKEDRLIVSVLAYPPNKRRHDIDNLCKGLLDSLQHAGLYPDDFQIDILRIERMPSLGGVLKVNVKSLNRE